MTPEELTAKYGPPSSAIVPLTSSTSQGPLSSMWNNLSSTDTSNPEGPLGGVANFIGGGKLAQGVGQALANATGAQDATIEADKQGSDIETALIKQIHAFKAQGKDTTRLEAALQTLGGNLQESGNKVTDLGTGGLSNKEVIGSAIQLGANAIPGAGEEAGLLEKSAIGAGQGYAYDVGNQLQNKDKSIGDAFIPGAGTVIGGALPGAMDLVGTVAKHVAGFTSGTGPEAIQRAVDNPDAVGKAVKEYATTPEAKQTLVDKAKAAVSQFIQDKQSEYGASLDKFGTQADYLAVQNVSDSFVNNAQKFGGSVDKEGNLIFKNSTLTKSDQTALNSAYETIQNWTDTTPKGMDGLRQAIGNQMDEFSLNGNDRANVVLSAVQKDLKNTLTNKIPGYSDMLNTYSTKSQTTRDLVKELGIGGSAKPSTQLNNVMRIFQKDPSIQKNLIKTMGQKGADDFMNEISGAILSDWLPQGKLMPLLKGAGEAGLATGAAIAGGGASAALPVAATGAAAMSPRIVGGAARLAGKAANLGVGKAVARLATMGAAETGQ
jgi:hypothetical protein